MVAGRGIVAQRELLAHVQKQLGVGVAAEDEVRQQQRGRVLARGAVAHGELRLRHVHRLRDLAHRFGRAHTLGDRRLGDPLARERRQRTVQRPLHARAVRAAAVEQLDARRGKKLAVIAVERLVRQPFHARHSAEPVDAVALTAAHLLQKPRVGVVALVVENALDGVDQIFLLTLHIVAQEAPVPRERVEQQLAEQVGHRLEQPLSAGDITLVKKAADKAEALILALLAHGVGDGRPVQAVQLRGDRAHIAVRGRAAAQHGGQQRTGGDGALFQRRDELCAQHAGLEFCGGDVGQKNALRQFLSQGLHKSGSFSILY